MNLFYSTAQNNYNNRMISNKKDASLMRNIFLNHYLLEFRILLRHQLIGPKLNKYLNLPNLA